MRNLINIINEAEVKPGERKNISFNVNRLDKMLKKLTAYKKNAQAMSGMDIPDSAKAELESVISKVNDIATVASVYNPLSIYVRLPNNWSSVETKKHDLEKLDTKQAAYQPGDKAIIVASDYYNSNDYGKMVVITKVYKNKVIASKVTKTGKVSKISEEYPKNDIIPANSQIAMKLFPKLITNVQPNSTPTQKPNVYADIIAKLQPKIKTGALTYNDIDSVAQNLDYDPDKLIAMLKQQGIKVNPISLPGNI